MSHLTDRTVRLAGSLTIVLGLAAAAAPATAQSAAPRPDPAAATRPPLGPGETVVVIDPALGAPVRRNPERAARRFPPCSTYKIPNALIALETGALDPEHTEMARHRERVPARSWWPKRWDRDQTLETALQYSVLWYFQEVARRIGPEEMQRRLDAIGYGNRDISGGIDRFWLSSSLAISADEQADFLRRLRAGELGFAPRWVKRVSDALTLERGDGWRLVGKTGACQVDESDDAPWVGWLVGWVERQAGDVLFAANVEGPSWDSIKQRRFELVRGTLEELGYLPAKSGD